ncbi:MAG: hypothetical protein PHQ27_02175 [Victivallales bacterium]|nr:hypothetical protein [Victivallales bacterium]
MTVSIRDIETSLEKFMAGHRDFSFAAAINALPPVVGTEEEQARMIDVVTEILTADQRLFCDRTGENFFSRAAFLQGKKFCVTPTRFEINQGILFPGHRFAPYCAVEVFPSEVTLREEEGGKGMATREVRAPLAEVIPCHMLLGAEAMFDFLVADHPDNAALLQRIGSADGEVIVVALDLKDFYRRYEFEVGDALEVTVVDWEHGVFSCRGVPGSDRPVRARSEWIEKFTVAVEEVIESDGEYLEIPEQLARAVYCGGPELLVHPAASIDEFFRQNDAVQIGYVSGSTVLVMKSGVEAYDEEDAAAGPGVPDEMMISQGKTGNLTEILTDAGSLLRPVEIETVMLDQLYHDLREFDDFYQRCFGNEKLSFADAAQEAVFINFVEDLWETRSESYNRFEDDAKGVVRERLLELIEARLNWLRYTRDLEFDLTRLQDEPAFRSLASGAVHCHSLCELLNSDANFISASEVENMLESLDKMGELQQAQIEELERKIAAGS